MGEVCLFVELLQEYVIELELYNDDDIVEVDVYMGEV